MKSGESIKFSRRHFMQLSALSGAGLVFYRCSPRKIHGTILKPEKLVGNLAQEKGATPIKMPSVLGNGCGRWNPLPVPQRVAGAFRTLTATCFWTAIACPLL